MDDLIPEILQKIFSHLEEDIGWPSLLRYRLVSQYWKINIEKLLEIKKEIDLSPTGYNVQRLNPKMIITIADLFPNLKSLIVESRVIHDGLLDAFNNDLLRLNFKFSFHLSLRGMTSLVIKYYNLRFLDVSGAGIKEAHLSLIVDKLKNLEELRALDLYQAIEGSFLKNLSNSLESLFIDLRFCNTPQKAIKYLLEGNGKQLKQFGLQIDKPDNLEKLSSLNHLENLELYYRVDTDEKLKLGGFSQNLKRLSIIEYPSHESNLSIEFLTKFFMKSQKIEHLKIQAFGFIFYVDNFMIRNLTKLRNLILTGGTILKASSSLGDLEQLSYIYFKYLYIERDALNDIMMSPKIKKIVLETCSNLNHLTYCDIAQAIETRKDSQFIIELRDFHLRTGYKYDPKGDKVNKTISGLPKNESFW